MLYPNPCYKGAVLYVLICLTEIPKQIKTKIEDPDNAAFHQGLHCLLRLKQFSETEMHNNLETTTFDPLKYKMGYPRLVVLFDFINLTQVHNFTASAQDIFTFRRLSVFTVSFTGILQVLIR